MLEKGSLGGALRLGCDGMAGIVSSCLPKVCRRAGTVLGEFGFLEPRLDFGPAGNHFCAIQCIVKSLLGCVSNRKII